MGHYIVFAHGIGEQKQGSYQAFGDAIRSAFERETQKKGNTKPSPEAFVWQEAFWADVTQPDEQKMKGIMSKSDPLRGFMIGSLGDIIAYSKLTYPPDKYGEIQKRFADAINKLSQKAQELKDNQASLTIVSHSLGTVIASDGLYELNKSGTFPKNLRLDRFFTMGSPIALYGLRYGLANFNKPVRPPLWVNIYYPQDLIGFPLKPLNPEYASAISEEISLSSGGGSLWTNIARRLIAVLPGAKIASHSWYFTDKRVHKRIAEALIADSGKTN